MRQAARGPAPLYAPQRAAAAGGATAASRARQQGYDDGYDSGYNDRPGLRRRPAGWPRRPGTTATAAAAPGRAPNWRPADQVDRDHPGRRCCSWPRVGTYFWADSKLRREVDLARSIDRPETGDGTNYLIVGSDSREGMSAAGEEEPAHRAPPRASAPTR